jgi:hypothetical protein
VLDDSGIMTGGVDYKLGFDCDRVNTGYLPRKRLDWRPVYYQARYTVFVSQDHIVYACHVLKFYSGVTCSGYEFRACVRAVGNEQPWFGLFVWHTQIFECFIGWISNHNFVHQVSADPETAAEVVIALDDHDFHAMLGQDLAADKPARAGSGDQNIGLDILVELPRELAHQCPGDIFLA